MKGYLVKHVRNTVQEACRHIYPHIDVRPFGSSICGLDSQGSDIDLAVTDKDLEYDIEETKIRTAVNVLQRVLGFLRQRWAKRTDSKKRYKLKLLPIFHCKVPIIKITDPEYELQVDLSVWRAENDIKIASSRPERHKRSHHICDVINDFNDLDKRVQPFLVAVKFWSKQRKINDASRNKINSFGYVLLAVKFLQHVHPPILPDLQEWKQKEAWKQ